MNLNVLDPATLVAAQSADAGLVYLDVRTVAEFAGGRPRGRAANVPWVFFHPTSGEAVPNANFHGVMEANFAKESVLVVGGGEDDRAETAANALVAAGYLNVRVLQGGYPAWRRDGMLFSTDNRPGVSYVSLLMRAKRPDGAAAKGH